MAPRTILSLRLVVSSVMMMSSSAWSSSRSLVKSRRLLNRSLGNPSMVARKPFQTLGRDTMRLCSSSQGKTPSTTKSYALDGIGRGTSVRATTNTGHQLTTDIPLAMGGQDEAPQPVEVLLGSWMGCTQATASFVARQILLEKDRAMLRDQNSRKRRRPNLEVRLVFKNIEAFRDERGALELPIQKIPEIPSRLQRITGTIAVSILDSGEENGTHSKLSSEELMLLREQTEARCPIANMILSSGCTIDVEWIQE